MFALRSLARSTPRAAARFTSQTARYALRPTFKSSILSTLPKAAFSTTVRRRDATSQELALKLSQEIELEGSGDNNTPSASDENAQNFLASHPDWTLKDIPGQSEVSLTKKYEDEEVTVSFSIVDFNSQLMDSAEEDDALLDDEEDAIAGGQSHGGNSKGAINQGSTKDGNFKVAPEDDLAPADREDLRDDEDNEPAFPANISVTITRPGKGVLRVNMVTDSGELTYHSLAHFDDIASADAAHSGADSKLYTGPPFQQLDEEVQHLIEAYLAERGIDSSLAVFVPEYIDVKEQKEYLHWLEKVRGFVE